MSGKSGCFQWVVTLKQSCTVRWAKFRNGLIQRFRKNNQSVRTTDLVNDTGTPDLVFTQKPVTEPERSKVKTNGSSDADTYEKELEELSTTLADDALRNALLQLDESALDYFSSKFSWTAINNATHQLENESRQICHKPVSLTPDMAKDIPEMALKGSLSNLFIDKAKSPSLTSDVIDDIAETAVRTSLTNIIADTNQSAKRRPKTVAEYMESLGFEPFPAAKDGMPRVDI